MHAAGGRPSNLDNGKARACFICSWCEWGCLDISFSRLSMDGWMDDLGFYFLLNRICYFRTMGR